MITLIHDAGPDAGLGHQRRMEALAAAFAARGEPTALVAVDSAAAPLPGHEAGVVVVDSYWHRADQVKARVVAAVDDLARGLDIDLLVEPAESGPSEPGHLRGLSHAIVDPDSADVGPNHREGEATDVLVACGGADRTGVGGRVAGAVADLLPDARVRLVVGPWATGDVPARVEAVTGALSLLPHLRRAHIVVTAAGVTLLESLAVGTPTVTFAMVDNQTPYLAAVASARAAVTVAHPDDAAPAVAAMACDSAARTAMSARARRTVDGHGASRIVTALLAIAGTARTRP